MEYFSGAGITANVRRDCEGKNLGPFKSSTFPGDCGVTLVLNFSCLPLYLGVLHGEISCTHESSWFDEGSLSRQGLTGK